MASDDLDGSEAGEVLPDEDAGGQHQFAAQHGVTALPTPKDDRELGGWFVPQAAEVLERLPAEPLGLIDREGSRALGQRSFQQAVELTGMARCGCDVVQRALAQILWSGR